MELVIVNAHLEVRLVQVVYVLFAMFRIVIDVIEPIHVPYTLYQAQIVLRVILQIPQQILVP